MENLRVLEGSEVFFRGLQHLTQLVPYYLIHKRIQKGGRKHEIRTRSKHIR